MKRWQLAPALIEAGPLRLRRRHPPLVPFALQPALSGTRHSLQSRRADRISWYQDGPAPTRGSPPMLLMHGIGAAASAYDVRPLYEHYRHTRRVYAVEFPGYGFSARQDRRYTPRLMTDAVHEVLEQIRREYGYAPVDALALSLSCEFLARAATENSAAFRSVALASPTGLSGSQLREGRAGSTMGTRWTSTILMGSRWQRPLYDFITRPMCLRLSLRRVFGSRRIDPGLLEYDWLVGRQAGAQFAPMSYLSGCLYSGDSGRLYRGLKKPVWLVHGTRGAYARYAGLARLADRRNWTVQTLPTGAMPWFEMPEEFIRRYDAWLEGVCQTAFPNVALGRTDGRAESPVHLARTDAA
ncbi:MAG: alpha/beta hydrolase [Steroidobacteraceae bacterium]